MEETVVPAAVAELVVAAAHILSRTMWCLPLIRPLPSTSALAVPASREATLTSTGHRARWRAPVRRAARREVQAARLLPASVTPSSVAAMLLADKAAQVALREIPSLVVGRGVQVAQAVRVAAAAAPEVRMAREAMPLVLAAVRVTQALRQQQPMGRNLRLRAQAAVRMRRAGSEEEQAVPGSMAALALAGPERPVLLAGSPVLMVLAVRVVLEAAAVAAVVMAFAQLVALVVPAVPVVLEVRVKAASSSSPTSLRFERERVRVRWARHFVLDPDDNDRWIKNFEGTTNEAGSRG